MPFRPSTVRGKLRWWFRTGYVSDGAERTRADAQREFDAAKKSCEEKKKEIKKRGLKEKERASILEQELKPFEQTREENVPCGSRHLQL